MVFSGKLKTLLAFVVLQNITEYYRILQNITEYSQILQNNRLVIRLYPTGWCLL